MSHDRDPVGHASKVEEKAREHHGGKEASDHGVLERQKLPLRRGGEKKSEEHGEELVEKERGEKPPDRTVHRNVEGDEPHAECEKRARKGHDVVRDDLRDGRLPRADRRCVERLDRAALPLARDDEARQKAPDQSHRDDEKPRNEVPGARVRLVEPSARRKSDRGLGGRALRNTCGKFRVRGQLRRDRRAHVGADHRRLIGVDPVDREAEVGFAR